LAGRSSGYLLRNLGFSNEFHVHAQPDNPQAASRANDPVSASLDGMASATAAMLAQVPVTTRRLTSIASAAAC
jgi:hypothetical protein